MATAPASSSHPGWKAVRDAVLPALTEDAASKNAKANWRFVMDALMDDTAPEPQDHRQQRTAVHPIESTSQSTTQYPTTHSSDMSTSQEVAISPHEDIAQNNAPSTSQQPPTQVETQPEQPIQSSQPVKEVLWGSREDVDALNSDIQSCLEVEGFQNPSSFFTENIFNFPSVAHYYVDVLNKLDEVGIDLFASLEQHLGGDHVLVQGICSILREQPQPQRTYITREPTNIAEELDRAGVDIPVPGFRAFSQESRALSWVVRNDQIVPRGLPDSFPPIPGSMDGTEMPMSGPKRDQIVCPGLPVSYDTYSQPQPPPQRVMSAMQQPPQKKTMFGRFMSCFCFAS